MAIQVTSISDANAAFTSSTQLTVDFLELRGTNGPDAKVYQIIQFNGGGGYGWQIALGTDHYNLYKRHCRSGKWTKWVRFWPP